MIGRVAVLLASLAAPAAAQSFGSPGHYTEQGGEAIYRGVCAACHMPDGHGAVGAGAYPSLANDARLADPGFSITLILAGSRAMPSFARTLSDQQIADVTAYIRTHFGNAYLDALSAAEVQAARRGLP